jgi:hypothetical protein
VTDSRSRFVVGIDLGTTHSALAYVDTEEPGGEGRPHELPLPQLVARGTVEERLLLPSFVYFGHESDGAMPLPWDAERTFAVGTFARSRGAEAPTRLASSAKSWLCHPTVDRRSGLLPREAADDIEKVSPVEISYRLLDHLAETWNRRFGAEPGLTLAETEVVLTVPASFDAAARDLTAEAAMAAGIDNLTLLEEPQAALYAWLDGRGGQWRKELRPGDVLLVVDVGGGTTDFSAIAVTEREGSLELHRVAVGDHILLGGDNMDLALAYAIKRRLGEQGTNLDAWQTASLVHGARAAKEQLLTSAAPEAPVVIPGRGSKLLGGQIRTTLTRDELDSILVDGFFPVVEASARPVQRARAGLTQVGLPYAQDAGITRHLASFLARQADAVAALPGFTQTPVGALLHPTAVLFNGGVMKGDPLRERLLSVLQGWLAADGAPPARVLEGSDLDLAVARGAAVYGASRRGRGIRIRGGTARAYYVGIESAMPAVPGMEPEVTALCVAPFGMEEGSTAATAAEELGLVVGEPVRFRFFGSTVRRDDAVGQSLERFGEELEELPPIEATLPAEGRRPGDVVPVRLAASVTEVGTLLLEAVPTQPLPGRDRTGPDRERWKIELSVRGGAGE